MEESYKGFKEKFNFLLKKEKKRPISIKQFLSVLSGRGKILFLIFFLLPVSQIPVLSTFFGFVICYMGLRIGLSKRSIWLPKKIQNKKIPSYFLRKSIQQILFGLKILQRWSRARFKWAKQTSAMHRFNGIMIALVGLALAVCPPLPLTGTFSFLAILFIGIGGLNEDGVYLLFGYAFTLIYFLLVAFLLEIFSIEKSLNLLKIFLFFNRSNRNYDHISIALHRTAFFIYKN